MLRSVWRAVALCGLLSLAVTFGGNGHGLPVSAADSEEKVSAADATDEGEATKETADEATAGENAVTSDESAKNDGPAAKGAPKKKKEKARKGKKPTRKARPQAGNAGNAGGTKGGGAVVLPPVGGAGGAAAGGAGQNAGKKGQAGAQASKKAQSKSKSTGKSVADKAESNPAESAIGGGNAAETSAPDPELVEKVMEVQNKHTPALMKQKGISGTATGLDENGNVVIKVYTTGADSPKIPKQLDGVPVEVVLRGPVFTLDGTAGSPQFNPKERFNRPIPIGVSSISFFGCDSGCSAGTIGCRLRARDGSGVFGLSNNHVFARNNLAPLGTSAVQPSPGDDNCACNPDNEIGTLFRFKETDFDGGINRIDAAIIQTSDDLVGNATLPDGYGRPRTFVYRKPFLGQKVMKYGRTSGFTKGRIVGLNAFVPVNASEGIALYDGQIEVTGIGGAFGGPGDSGSLVVDENRFPVGLLFAGGGGIVDCNPIQEVLDEFGMEIDGDDSRDFVPPGKVGRARPNQ